MLIPAFGIYSMLEKANKAIWQEVISCHFKNIQNACSAPFGFIFYLKPLTAMYGLQRGPVNTEAGNSSVLTLYHLLHTGPYHYLFTLAGSKQL